MKDFFEVDARGQGEALEKYTGLTIGFDQKSLLVKSQAGRLERAQEFPAVVHFDDEVFLVPVPEQAVFDGDARHPDQGQGMMLAGLAVGSGVDDADHVAVPSPNGRSRAGQAGVGLIIMFFTVDDGRGSPGGHQAQGVGGRWSPPAR